MSSNRLFIGGLSWDTTDDSLKEAFAEFGTVEEARVIVERSSGRSKGFGFVTFEDSSLAETALNEMNGKELDGRTIRVDYASAERKDRGGDNNRRGGDRRSGPYNRPRDGGFRGGRDRNGGGRRSGGYNDRRRRDD